VACRRLAGLLAVIAGCGARSALEVDGPDARAAEDAFDARAEVRPDVAVPDVAAPDVAVPDVAAPDVAAPDVAAPDVAAPDVAAPDVAAPDVAVPDVAAPDVAAAVCGNGRVESGEACDLGAENALVPAFRLSPGARPTEAVQPLQRPLSAASFYRYESASAHTGFEGVGLANAFLYVNRGDNVLSLFFLAGRDDDGTMPAQPMGEMEVWFRGVPREAQVAVSDDNEELARQDSGDVRGRWSFEGNTDGGVLSQLPWDRAWRVVVEPSFRAGVTAARYLHRDGRATALGLRDSFAIEHFSAPSRCRPDCRVPRCGDGFVDGGERCDDGNTVSGDGCSATCQRIE